jgi:formyl-CoA transferase/CoA:oxalate CoA-transferase
MDLIVQAESGMISVTGEPGGGGARVGVSIADMQAGLNATIAILMALHARQRTGVGQFIDISMLEGQLTLLDHSIGIYLADRVPFGPMGTAYRTIVPYQTFRTRTEDLALAVGSDALWRAFCPLVGAPELTDDPRYVTNAARVANRVGLVARLQEIFLTRSYAEWEAILEPAGIPVGAIRTLDRVVEHPQVAARGVLQDSRHPAASAPVIAPYFRMSGTPGGVRAPAPLLGQHTDAVLAERLGLGPDELARLRSRGVLGSGTRAPRKPGGASTSLRTGAKGPEAHEEER